MSMALVHPASDRGRSLLRWGLCSGVVVAIHLLALVALRRTVPSVGPEAPAAIMIELAPESAAPPEPAAVEPPVAQAAMLRPAEPEPPEPQPPEPPSPIEPPPDLVLPVVPDVPLPAAPIRVPPPLPRPILRRPPPRPRPPVEQTPLKARTTETAPPQAPVEAPSPAAAPAQPGPAATTAAGQARATWESVLAAHIARFKRFPPAAERRGEQGTAMMRLVISRNGAVLAMTVVRGSGYAALDQEAQAWITRAVPLPAFPPHIAAQQMEVIVPLRFLLR